MLPGDSLTPGRDGPERSNTQHTARSPVQEALAAERVLCAPVDAAVTSEFESVFGRDAPTARAAIEAAVSLGGRTAYEQLRATPEAFGTVTGDRSLADMLGRRLEALDASRAVYRESMGGNGAPEEARLSLSDGRDVRRMMPERTPDQVREALDTVRWCLTEGRVTYEDLRTADGALWRLAEPGDASRVITALNEEGLLGKWAEEMNDNFYGPLRGFDTDERQAFYNRLAHRLDGEALDHFATAVEASADMARPGDEGERFGQAVAAYASPEARGQFVERVLPRVSAQLDGGPQEGVLARAAVETIGGLTGHGEWLRDSVAALSRQGQTLRLQAGDSPVQTPLVRLIGSGVVARTSTERDLLGTQQIRTFDSGPAVRMVRALATVDDPSLRAQAFMDASQVAAQLHLDDTGNGQRLDTVERGAAERDLRSAQATLLLNRPNETITSLMVQGDRSGKALTAYVQDLLHRGDSATITRDIRSIQRGDEQNQDARTRFVTAERDAGGNMTYANAARLGYYVGAVTAAFQGFAGRDRDAARTLTHVIGAVVHVPGVQPLASAVGDVAADARIETLQQQLNRLKAGMIPTVGTLNERGETERAEVNGPEVGAYENALDGVTNPSGELNP